MESWYKNVSKIHNVTFIFFNIQKNFQKRKKILKKFKWILENKKIYLK